MEYSAMGFERSNVDPAFTETFISGMRFSTEEEAEAYGRNAFAEMFAGVKVFYPEKEEEKPF